MNDVKKFSEELSKKLDEMGIDKENAKKALEVAENHFATDFLADDNSEGSLDYFIEEVELFTDKAVDVADAYYSLLEEFKNA